MKLIGFEWRYHTRQVSFAAAAVLFFAIGLVLTGTGFGSDSAHVNSPYNIAESLGLASLASVFILAIFCANAVVRDRELGMEEIVFTTAVTKFDYLFGRFIGAFLAAFTAFSATALGMIAASLMPWHDPERLGAFQPHHYAGALLAVVLPGMLFAAVVLFGVAALTRSVIASVVGAVFIYVLYFVAASLTNSPLMASSRPGADAVAGAALLDPFGLSPFFEQTRYWSTIERNARMVSLTGDFLLNRLLWIGLAILLWAVVYRAFSFRLLASGAARIRTAEIEVERSSSGYRPIAAPAIGSTGWRALFSQLRLEVRSWITTLPFALITLLWTALAAFEMIAEVQGGEYGTAIYPTTGILLATIAQPLSLVATIVVIYYAAEIVSRERTVGFDAIANATPAPGWVFVFSKWLTLSLMVVTLTAASSFAARLLQLARGYTNPEPSVMFAFGWIAALPIIVFAMAAIFVQTIVAQKYAGMIVVLLVAVIQRAGGLFGLEHPLLRFGAAPPTVFSEMNRFGASLTPFHWFMALWLVVGLLLLVTAALAWKQVETKLVRRLPRTIGRRAALAIAVLAGCALLLGGAIFYRTNILNDYETGRGTMAWRAAYERKYKPMAPLPRPQIAGITAEVELRPAAGSARVVGSYLLVNRGSSPIARLLVTVRRDVEVTTLSIPAAAVSHDDAFNVYTFDLQPALGAGRRTRLDFDLLLEPKGFDPAGENPAVAANGTFLPSWNIFPSIGYRRGYEIVDPQSRRERGLPPLAREASSDIESGDAAENEWAQLDLTVATDGDQTAVAPGKLLGTSTEGARRRFHYRTEGPVRAVFIIASGRYAAAGTSSHGTAITLLHDPRHSFNRDRIVRVAASSLGEFGRRFGRYQGERLTIVEVPSWLPFGGFATPGVIFLNEKRALLVDARDPDRLDLVARRVAHEVAHQWWGHYVAPPSGPGASTIVETLTKYSELQLLEKEGGRRAVRELLSRELDAYLEGRADAAEPEPPLTRVSDEAWLYYRKGAIVMHAIDELLGSERLDRALRGFAEQYGGAGKSPTARNLLDALNAVASRDEQLLIRDWLDDVVLYDLSITAAIVERMNDGHFKVRLRVDARRVRVEANGRESSLPIDETIAIALLGSDPDGPPLYEGGHRLHAGTNAIELVTAKRPAMAAVDRDFTRLDRNVANNVKSLE